ncbi:3-hydroxyacyl-ACP dehydratase FabZ [Membranicola marinus]|uniref:3-hydroxyacyl-[acyl-carrier-protein] dehydratase FabZ n=1 Tax=Membranihabitans marinus TaxID=1227546 RepID=A0A953L6P1_9BACT|nr:3-hydroxyacyl-ACP dehydratase FabZ [Membranihabitans marinus]MBY5957867.1 3-hydroxyacyl-ACP dehydratase FabZ [Membranihabitans marinus]
MDNNNEKQIPHYDPNQTPVKDIREIMDMLPHRYPFLLVDKIIELSADKVVGIKNITMNEACFQGHFPGNPIFPGVLQVEALAQTGGILALSQMNQDVKWDTYFLKIDNTKFRKMVGPGDTLILVMELIHPIRRGFCHMHGRTYVGDTLVSEGDFTAKIEKRKNS